MKTLFPLLFAISACFPTLSYGQQFLDMSSSDSEFVARLILSRHPGPAGGMLVLNGVVCAQGVPAMQRAGEVLATVCKWRDGGDEVDMGLSETTVALFHVIKSCGAAMDFSDSGRMIYVAKAIRCQFQNPGSPNGARCQALK